MAVIIQKLIGQRSHNRYYPQISGVAQSFNYYPFSYMKPDDGFSVMGVGLGKYIMGGEKAWRFCPRYPNLEHGALGDQIKDSQEYFYALDLEENEEELIQGGEDAFIRRLHVTEAEEDGNLRHCAQVYDINNDRLCNDFSLRGPRVLNFADILKYDYIPLADTLDILLRYLREAMGAPVEIEFALDLEGVGKNGNPTLWLLQIKPLIRLENHLDVDFSEVEEDRVILRSEKGMGNGRHTHIRDVVYMDVNKFDRTKTREMAGEIAALNKQMEQEGREYVLIGPGRWGTRDPSTGIPVYWSQISGARIIVEIGLPGFPLDPSLGSHFFHNVTSMNVGYFSVHQNNNNSEFVDLSYLESLTPRQNTGYFKHVEFDQPLTVLMDGKSQKAVVMRGES